LALIAQMNDTIHDWEGIGRFITARESVHAGRLWIAGQQDSLDSWIDYYRAKAAKMDSLGEDDYAKDLNWRADNYDNLYRPFLIANDNDLLKDSLLPESGEPVDSIKGRKKPFYVLGDTNYFDLGLALTAQMNDTIHDWEGIGRFLPDLESIPGKLTYLFGERDSTVPERLNYWNAELDTYKINGYQPGIAVCSSQVANAHLYGVLVDSLIFDLHKDSLFLTHNSNETPDSIVGRKINLSHQRMVYWVDLMRTLLATRRLVTPNLDSIGNFIHDSTQIDSGRISLHQQQDTINLTQKPFWQGENRNAVIEQDQPWIDFTNHGLRILDDRLVLIDSLLYDLDKDEAFINGSREPVDSIKARKMPLYLRGSATNKDIAVWVSEGMRLVVLDYDSVLPLIPIDTVPGHPEVQTVAQVKAFWLTDDNDSAYSMKMGRLERITSVEIPRWDSIIANPELSEEHRIIGRRWIENLGKEYDYGLNYAVPEAHKDSLYQEQNAGNESFKHVVARKLAARHFEREIVTERLDLVRDMAEFILKDLIPFHNFIQEQVEEALKQVRDRSGFANNPYGGLLGSLSDMGEAHLQRLQDRGAVKAARRALDEQQDALDQQHQAVVDIRNNYNQNVDSVKAKVIAAIDSLSGRSPQEREAIKDQLANFFAMKQRSPPTVERVGQNLYLNLPGEEGIYQRLPLVYIGDQDLAQYLEASVTPLTNGEKVEFPGATQFAALDILNTQDIYLDFYSGNVSAAVPGAPGTKYVVFAVRADPAQANYINNFMFGYEARSRFKEQYDTIPDTVSGHPRGNTLNTNYLLLANSFAINSADNKLFAAVEWAIELSIDSAGTGSNQIYQPKGIGKDRVYAITGRIGYNPNPRLALVLDAGFANAINRENDSATIVDLFTGMPVETSHKLLLSEDAFNFQRFSVELNPLSGDNQGRLLLNFGLNREQDGVDDAWGKRSAVYPSVGATFSPGVWEFKAEAGLGAEFDADSGYNGLTERFGAEVNYNNRLKGFYKYIDADHNFGAEATVFRAKDGGVALTYEYSRGRHSVGLNGIYGFDNGLEAGASAGVNRESDGNIGPGVNGKIGYKGGVELNAGYSAEGPNAGISVPITIKRGAAKTDSGPAVIRRDFNVADEQTTGKRIYDAARKAEVAWPQADTAGYEVPVTLQGERVVYTLKADSFMLEAYQRFGAIIYLDSAPRLLSDKDMLVPIKYMTQSQKQELRNKGMAVDELDERTPVLFVDGRPIPAIAVMGNDMLEREFAFWQGMVRVAKDGRLYWQIYGAEDSTYYTFDAESVKSVAAELPEGTEPVIGWINAPDKADPSQPRFALTSNTLDELYFEEGWRGHHVTTTPQRLNGKYTNVLRVKGYEGFDGKDAVLVLNHWGYQHLAERNKKEYIVIDKQGRYGFYIPLADAVGRRNEFIDTDRYQIVKLDSEGNETHRVYLKADKIEAMINSNSSLIYALEDNGWHNGEPIAEVKKINELLEAHPDTAKDSLALDVWQSFGLPSKRSERIYGIRSGTDQEGAYFYEKFVAIPGDTLRYLAVVDFGRRVADLPGEDSLRLREKGYHDDDSIQDVIYFNANFESIEADSLLQALPSAIRYAVVTQDKVAGYPSWKVIDNVDQEGDLVFAIAIDSLGRERAKISGLPENRDIYAIELLPEKQLVGDKLADRATYIVRKKGHIYSYDSGKDSYSRSYYTRELCVNLHGDTVSGLDSLIDNAFCINSSLKGEASSKLEQSVTNLARSLNIQGELCLLEIRVEKNNREVSHTYILESDPFARVVAFRLNREAIINVDWKDGYAVEGFQFKPYNIILHLRTVGKVPAESIAGLNLY
ncbi:hypothetical protein ACFL1K_05615, partial [Candidatus Omnitrophota bacterium]